MISEPEAQPSHDQLLREALIREKVWIAESPDSRGLLAHQFPSPIRPYQDLWMDSPPRGTHVPAHPPCPRCQNPNLQQLRVVEEVRHSGDAYGTGYQSCFRCGWTCWWRFDDAS